MRKFKVGDEVTVLRWSEIEDPKRHTMPVGSSFIVSKVEDCGNGHTVYTQVCFPFQMNGLFNTEIELSKVVGTPLYEALK